MRPAREHLLDHAEGKSAFACPRQPVDEIPTPAARVDHVAGFLVNLPLDQHHRAAPVRCRPGGVAGVVTKVLHLAEHARHAGVGFEECELPLDLLRQPYVIGIQAGDMGARTGSGGNRRVGRRAGAGVILPQHLHARVDGAGDNARVVIGAVVHNDDLGGRAGLVQRRADRLGDEMRGIVGGYDDAVCRVVSQGNAPFAKRSVKIPRGCARRGSRAGA